ncbi:MAG: YifB family Mg chelatase-like AAA ATPase [Rubrivivax sp.]
MSMAVVASRALDGLNAPAVQVEVQLANGLPSFTLVGLAEMEVREARERVRAALQQSGFAFPSNKRITVNLAPADLPKESGRFDLPIALGILAADGQVCPQQLARHEFAGELSLGGELRPVRGALALALAASRSPHGRTLVLPEASAAEAARVPGLDVRRAKHLAEVVAAMRPRPPGVPTTGADDAALPRAQPRLPDDAAPTWPDLRDVKGQAAAKRVLEVAASGGHHVLLVGPPGSGKSMLAERLPGLLPPLAAEHALAAAAIAGLQGDAPAWNAAGGRPWRAPHHTASAAALVGGGSPPRPGEISLAHGGVLFLDELPEFPRRALEALREPLETGEVTISRAARQASFPARFQLVAAMNPCPCGWLGAPASLGRICRCTADQVARYQGRLSGPLLDRIDLQVEVLAAAPQELLGAPDGEPSAAVAARVSAARDRQLARQGRLNAELGATELDARAPLEPAARSLLEAAAKRLGWSGRRLHRTIKVARTVADLSGREPLSASDVAEALQHQRVLAP